MFEFIKLFFEMYPDFGSVPTAKTQLDWKRKLLTIRPNFKNEGWTLILRCEPNKIAFINNLVCILLQREISEFNREYLLKVLPLFALDQRTFSLRKIEFVRGLILLNKKVKRSEIWQKADVFEEILGFKPRKSLSGIKTMVICEKVWFSPKKVLFPQRKLGYDDKGSLPPKDSVNWRELASNSEYENNFQNDESNIELPSGIWRISAVDAATDESTVLDEIPMLKEIL